MLSENGVWIAYDKIMAKMEEAGAIYDEGFYLSDLRDMALVAAREGIDDTDRPA